MNINAAHNGRVLSEESWNDPDMYDHGAAHIPDDEPFHNKGCWNLFLIGAEDKNVSEHFVGCVSALDGPEDMGCDIYDALEGAGWLKHDDIEAAEAERTDPRYDGANEISITMNDGTCYRVYYSPDDITEDIDAHGLGLLNDESGNMADICRRYMDVDRRRPEPSGWQCCNDHTGCWYNDGHNTCTHPGVSMHPLEDDE